MNFDHLSGGRSPAEDDRGVRTKMRWEFQYGGWKVSIGGFFLPDGGVALVIDGSGMIHPSM